MPIGTEARRVWTRISTFLSERTTGVATAPIDLETRSNIDDLANFSDRYLALAELLIASGNREPTTEDELDYKRLQVRLKLQYLEIRPFLLAFLRFDVEDEKVGLRYLGTGADAFEATWAPPSLEEFARSNDVFLRDRVGRALDALKYYNDHLTVLKEAAE